MPDNKFRFQLLLNGAFVRSYDTLVGAKIAVAFKARQHQNFNYRAVDAVTGETWGWDQERSKLERLDERR